MCNNFDTNIAPWWQLFCTSGWCFGLNLPASCSWLWSDYKWGPVVFPASLLWWAWGFRPQCTAEFAFSASKDATQAIIQDLHGSRSFEVDHHVETVFRVHKDFVKQCELCNDEFFPLLPQFDMVCHRYLWSGLSWMICLVGWLCFPWVGIILIWLLKSFIALHYRKTC